LYAACLLECGDDVLDRAAREPGVLGYLVGVGRPTFEGGDHPILGAQSALLCTLNRSELADGGGDLLLRQGLTLKEIVPGEDGASGSGVAGEDVAKKDELAEEEKDLTRTERKLAGVG